MVLVIVIPKLSSVNVQRCWSLMREQRLFNTGKGVSKIVEGMEYFEDQGGVNFVDLEGGCFFHTSLANIFNQCHRKYVFMKNKLILVYKI